MPIAMTEVPADAGARVLAQPAVEELTARQAPPDQGAHDPALCQTALLAWLSPAFPVGSFAYSHALEWAVHAGHVRDLKTARDWLAGLMRHGGLRNDAILAAVAFDAATRGEVARLSEANELGLALSGSRERHLETSAQGNAFRRVIAEAWLGEERTWAALPLTSDIAYPVAVGAIAGASGMNRAAMLDAFCLATVSNLISALVRLSAVGQTDGQRLVAALLPDAAALARAASGGTLDDLGGCAFTSDIASLRHETLYTRLFRS